MKTRAPSFPPPMLRAQGFTLVEVLVALIVIAIGMLGIAKLQALALSSTGAARMRSLAAIEASSLAAAMHANRGYWAAGTAPTFSVNGTALAVTSGALNAGAPACTLGAPGVAPCTNQQLASADVQTWITALNTLLPADTATVTCAPAAIPVSCTIQISWTENVVGANAQTAAVAAATAGSTTVALQNPTYTLYVVP